MSTFHLESFQGSLDFLLQLIQRKEVDLTELPLRQIFEQFNEENSPLEEGAEFIGSTSLLLFLKSKLLLPTLLHETTLVEEETYGALFTQLADYLKMREGSKELERLEEIETHLYDKGQIILPESPFHFPQVSLEELRLILDNILKEKKFTPKEIKQDVWQVADKIIHVRQLLIQQNNFSLIELFRQGSCKEEVIATFLAVLELIKSGEVRVSLDMMLETVAEMRK